MTIEDKHLPDSRGLVILVEDDAIVRMISGELLRDLQFEVLEAASAEEALAALRVHAADILITDLNLPGMSGDALAREARSITPSIGVIFASGDVSKAPPDRASPSYLLGKPYDAKDLARALEALAPLNLQT